MPYCVPVKSNGKPVLRATQITIRTISKDYVGIYPASTLHLF
ncbi:hypothetical protein HMPREF3192_00507 [Atopobium deltae]|uniref:Uncharacterized protein n=1 Tax=Atopobium deltae TaxID=1393034 RepID=A0A133XW23_9ACTN|nr:hypothetical protein HMPREF3192_00507 [Atopobium deltae]